MGGDGQAGVAFPASADGRRSTSALGRAVVADALRQVDPVGAAAAEHETDWRTGYLAHFRRLVEAGLPSGDAAVAIARDGLDSLHRRMRAVAADGTENGLDSLISEPARQSVGTIEVHGTGQPERELVLPYRGDRLHGGALAARLEAWLSAGLIEPSCADAVRTVAANPEWLGLPGRTVVVLGAGAEMGPLPALLNWGARVAAVDLPGAGIWDRILDGARHSGGTLVAPVVLDIAAERDSRPAVPADQASAQRCGLDVIAAVPAVADWIAGLDGSLVLGSYIYADGAAHVRAAAAVDSLTVRLQAERDDIALAFLATPTDVFAVPADAVEHSVRAYATRSRAAKLAAGPLRTLSGGRLLSRAYSAGADPGINDALVPQQGPNYALAKRLQRWRAVVARDGGATVSMNVAPPTRTRSVLKNRGLSAAYAGAHRFGVEIFSPDTSSVLMAALLVHDLHTGGGPAHAHPWQHEAHAAAHGGLWRIGYAPRSALGLAALLGYRSARAHG
jgi:hypothetical protein